MVRPRPPRRGRLDIADHAPTQAFVALGASLPGAEARLERGLVALADGGERVAAVSPVVVGPYESAPGRPDASGGEVANAVVEIRTALAADDLLARLHAIEDDAGRVRDGRPERALDLDLLDHGGAVRADAPTLPHPRALERAFVLEPWEAIAPLHRVAGTDRTVVEHAARLRAARPEAFQRLARRPAPVLDRPRSRPAVLADRASLSRWRDACAGTVGVVPTMGALHAGHASLFRRARAECDHVLATVFVNPLQFGPSEDLARYPRALDLDLDVVARAGADAVYAPAPEDVYAEGFATAVEVEGPAHGYEGARRPGHFRGVATVVLKLWQRTRPDRAYFGRKDAQQLAVIRRMVADLDLAGEVVACPIVRDPDGLAVSSRNRYLDAETRARALALSRALEELAFAAARGVPRADALASARRRLAGGGLEIDYVDVVDADAMTPARFGTGPALAMATVRAGSTWLLDNRWVACAGNGVSA